MSTDFCKWWEMLGHHFFYFPRGAGTCRPQEEKLWKVFRLSSPLLCLPLPTPSPKYKIFEVKSTIRAQQAPFYIDVPAHRWYQLCACRPGACPWGLSSTAFVRPLDTPSVQTPGVCQCEPVIQITQASLQALPPSPWEATLGGLVVRGGHTPESRVRFIRWHLRAVKPAFSIYLIHIGLEPGRDGVMSSFHKYPQIHTPGSV